MTDGNEDIAPPAWARVLLPDAAVPRYGRDSRCADFVLHIEPRTRNGEPAPPRDLAQWHWRFTRASTVFDTITSHLLAGELRLATSTDPSSKLAVWLNTPSDLTQLVDTSQYDRVAGTHVRPSYDGYAVADLSGDDPTVVATEWTRQLCDTALHLDDYEETLLTFGTA
ncbi:MAG: hypothetical protein ACRDRQ_16740 [Pseudonocardiaceae bacterium]